MIPKNRIPTHPGEILREEFLRPLGISQTRLAAHIDVYETKISAIINGRHGISPDMAWKLARALNTSPELWINLQSAYDLAKARNKAPALKPIRKAG